MRGQLDNSYAESGIEGGLAGGIQGMGILQGIKKSPWDFSDPTKPVNTNGLSLGADEQIANINDRFGQQQSLKPNLFSGGGLTLGMNSGIKKYSPY